MNPTGRARTETDIIDLSVLVESGLRGVTAVLGVTERGVIGQAVMVGSWAEYVRHFGGLLDTNIFPHLCKRALERGGKLRISRVAHRSPEEPTVVSGTKAKTTSGLLLTATSEGAWGNNLQITLSPAANGVSGQFDALIQLLTNPEYDKVVRNIPNKITQEAKQRFATENDFVVISSEVGEVVPVSNTLTITLTGGAMDNTVITPIDYIGDSAAGTGLHVFDNYNDFVKIAIPEMAVPEIDQALAAYVDARKDCRAILRTPTNISGLVAKDYRMGTGTFDHVPVDTWRATMVYGEVEVTHPITGAKVTLPAIGDILGCYAQKDTTAYEWFTTAGAKRGRLKNVLNVGYNLGTPARATEFDQLVNSGVNPVVDDTDFGPVYWGSSTLHRASTLLKHDNVADLLIYLGRGLAPLVRSELFEPNDVITWGNIFRKVTPFMDLIKSRRGIWDYLYEGDQFVDSVAEAQINNALDIDAGMYVFYLWIQPKVALKYIGIKVIITNSGVNFEEMTNQPTF